MLTAHLSTCISTVMHVPIMHDCIHVHAYLYTSTHTYMSIYMHSYDQYIYFNRSEVDIQTCLNTCMYAYKHPYLRTCMNIRLSESTCANKHMCTQYISILAKAKSIHLNQEDAQMHTWVSAHMHISKRCKQTCYLHNYLHLQDCMQAHMYICIPAPAS